MVNAPKNDLASAKRVVVRNTVYVKWFYMDKRYAQARFGSRWYMILTPTIVMSADREKSMSTGSTNVYKRTVEAVCFSNLEGIKSSKQNKFSSQILRIVSHDEDAGDDDSLVIAGPPRVLLLREQKRADRAKALATTDLALIEPQQLASVVNQETVHNSDQQQQRTHTNTEDTHASANTLPALNVLPTPASSIHNALTVTSTANITGKPTDKNLVLAPTLINNEIQTVNDASIVVLMPLNVEHKYPETAPNLSHYTGRHGTGVR
ncbi:hypothetical protein SARC_02829 [Sphaeroforma arctica JP610]|uniref:Uncharacterized protein n=1 Tax=Sphaeroforma arctica JP610 TaxID=667725 RepID=A0A0L0G7S3_9EUKA|nr:hypothetical protein SARC_02829 [Sphaeroforma arctica JP610]KNC84974.1 hypothetical protein SARC_02829 [Sphaeroforma arctica JP610]|eukprot:XP_014158876.1 hypothetical protein SARC_02829 [Sphaeroforma arctica JP610]